MENYKSFDFVVGTVREIKGTSVIIRMLENTNQLFYFLDGERYSGIVIGTYIGIRRNDYIVVGKVEKEYAYDTHNDPQSQEFQKERFIRELEIKVLGSFHGDRYSMGMEAFPQLFNDAILLSDHQKKIIIEGNDKVFVKNNKKNEGVKISPMLIGKLWPDGIDYNLKWYELFNTHIAVFGNTGSGKSNTVAKLYYELFNYKYDNKLLNFSKSRFLLLDFNGEYESKECITRNKDVVKLNTREAQGFFKIPTSSFWNKDMLSVLFGATEQTQQPFLTRVLTHYFNDEKDFKEQLPEYISQAFVNIYSMPNKHGLDLFKKVLAMIDLKNDEVSPWIDNIAFHAINESFYTKNDLDGWKSSNGRFYWNAGDNEDALQKEKKSIKGKIEAKKDELAINNVILQLQIASNLRLIYDLRYNIAQYDHIAPLLHRMETRVNDFVKVIKVVPDTEIILDKTLTILSLKRVNQDMKQLIPLIVAKSTYDNHKNSKNGLNYFNLIVDEAHNILSESSKRESEKWKDYRLEVFEEIVKEGRKFGYFLTISSQRPSDISPTIVSQVHNYFIHRLVNDNDLRLLDNTLTSLDRVSKESIPNLSPGQAVLTGVLFDLPLTIKVDILPELLRPNSDNISLIESWLNKES